MTTVRVQLSKELNSFWQTVLVTIFLCLNFYNFSTFTNNVGHIWFTIQNFCFGKNYIFKKCNSKPFCFLIKRVTEKKTQVKTLLTDSNPYLLMVLLSIPFNKLPCSKQLCHVVRSDQDIKYKLVKNNASVPLTSHNVLYM